MAVDDQFYREYILDHYKKPLNFSRLENLTSATRRTTPSVAMWSGSTSGSTRAGSRMCAFTAAVTPVPRPPPHWASEMAVALGTKDVVNFRGGLKVWREAGKPVEKPGE